MDLALAKFKNYYKDGSKIVDKQTVKGIKN